MSFFDCIEDAVRGGVLTRDQAETLYQKAQDYERTFTLDPQHSPESAARLGQDEALKAMNRQTRHARYQAAKQAIINSDNVRNIRSHPGGTARGLSALLGRDLRGGGGYSNIDFRAKAVLGEAHATFAEGLSALRTTAFGLKQDRALLQRVIREVLAENTGDARAAGIAKLWTDSAETLRQRFNRAGGAIARRKDWGLPQTHEPHLVAAADKGDWINFTRERLQLEAMTNADGAQLSPGELDLLLQDIYATISTDGLNKLIPGAKGGTKLANRRQEHRVLVFKDADSWLEYADRFGKPDLFGTMTSHMDSMAHDIALLEILGPNPHAAFRLLEDVTIKDGAGALARAHNESLFRIVNGNTERNASPKLADFADAVRSWLVAAKLGSATLSAASDVGFVAITAKWNGLPFTRVMRQMLTQLNPANEADRIIATKMGLTAMQWSNAMMTANRYSEIVGRGAAGKAAEFTLRASGLTAWTDAWKRGFGMELFGLLGDQVDRPFARLADKTQSAFNRYGIDAGMWEDIRATALLEHGGARYVSIENIAAREDLPIQRRELLNARMQEMVLTEANFAVPEPDARARVLTSGALFGQGSRGTFSGEVARGTFQFKGFPVSALLFHVYRAINAKGGPINPLAYSAQLMIATTLLGGLAIQLKEISRGKNPRPVNDARFWPAAMIQGGGLGIYGDFLFSDVNRFGGGLTSSIAGPFTDLIDDTAKLTLGQVWDVAQHRDTNIAGEVLDYARRYTPGGSLWYGRLVFEREVLDQLQLMADPKAKASFRRREQNRRRRYNQDYWWRHGQTAPEETPQLEDLVQ